MDNLKLEIVRVNAFVIEHDNEFTIFTEGKGGPIITHNDENEARIVFEKAMRASCAIKNFLLFADAVKNVEVNISDSKKLSRPDVVIEYTKQYS